MSCMGLDVGYLSSVVAVPKGGGIEVLLNDYSKRQTPSCISFGDKMRSLGESGKQRAVTAFKHTITYFKRLIGRKYDAPDVQEELAHVYFGHCALPDGTVGVKVQHADEQLVLSVPQVLAMLLGHLRTCAETALETKVEDCVMGVPVYFNDAQRHAMLEALQIADLNCLRLLNETSAVAVNYGIYKGDLPEPGEAPRRVAFFDFGHSNLQMSLCEFVKGKVTVVTTAACPVGGRDFDRALLKEMAKRFEEKTKLNFLSKPRAAIRMETECEKLKKMMSANATDIPMNVECLMEDRDFSTKMNRDEFEQLCAPVFDKVRSTVAGFVDDLKNRDIAISDLHSVEIVGGSSRIPLVKQILMDTFGAAPHTTLNVDEAVARGCALMSAIMSPMFRVRDFKLDDATPYAVNLSWQSTNPEEEEGQSQSEIFSANGMANVTKLLTFYRQEDFEFTATYANPERVPDQPKQIGNFKIQGVKPSYDGEKQKVKVEVQMDLNGCLNVRSATMLEKVPPAEDAAETPKTPASDNTMDTTEDKAKDDESSEEPAAKKPELESEGDDANKASGNDKKKKKGGDKKKDDKKKDDKKDEKAEEKKDEKKKKKVKKVKLTVVTWKPCLKMQSEINDLVEFEAKMKVQDLHEKEKNDARNALEEYIYEMRDKLSSVYDGFMTQNDHDEFRSRLSQMEDWLYEEGEDQPKTVYIEKLQGLQATGNEVKARAQDWETRPRAEEKLRETIVHFRKFVDEHAAGEEKYAHIAAEQVKKVADAVAETEEWLNTKSAEQAKLPKSTPPVLTTKDLDAKRSELERTCNPIMSTPKPKVEPPKEEEKKAEQPEGDAQDKKAEGEEADAAAAKEGDNKQEGSEEPAKGDNVMDTD
ncbi:HS24/P52 protein [Salpingoeca rosetta]|uniref:HS24/P52 protein n=1 Tax=Salpingoeca rosetta (strain ATCC 50818 / BSB-021) TaxID=946362 RepID=F2U6R9_SALR5|nr:HS24/P52 protein [Salpingoeca rosetta]EGD83551.1 HS24/P52 protein [Salpingoeca rosetta]|eukprot:XP_004995055.1 HS24/P52 protein [Salpingoeca rosetta]